MTLVSNFFTGIWYNEPGHTAASFTELINAFCSREVRAAGKSTWLNNAVEFGFATAANIK